MAENTQEMVLERIVTIQSNPLENRVIKIDNEAADECGAHTFDGWTEMQNKKNRFVISWADIYQAVKEGDKKLIKSLRKDMEESWIVLNPLHDYKDNLLTDIIHYPGSKNPVICRNLVVPVWDWVSLYDVLETVEGLVYFQVTNGTRDNAKAIKKAYYELSGCKADETFVDMPSQNSRKVYPKRASGFGYVSSEFLVDGSEDLDGSSRSRGVRISAAKKIHRK